MDRKKREEDLRKQAERRGPSRHSSRGHRRERDQEAGDGASQPQQTAAFRTDSPPIPTLRGQPPPPATETETTVEDTGTRPASPGVVDQLQNMRQSLDRRRESLQYEDEKLGETWNGLAEL